MILLASCQKEIAFDHIGDLSLTIEAKKWVLQSDVPMKMDMINLPMNEGLSQVRLKLCWDSAVAYTYKGIDYVDIPYFMENGERHILAKGKPEISKFTMVVRRNKDGNWEGGIRISTLNAYSSGEMQGRKWVEQLTTFEGKPANIWVRNLDGSGIKPAFPAPKPSVGSLTVLSSCDTYSNTTYTIYCYYANAQDYASMNATCTPYGTTNYFTFCGSGGGGSNPDENDNWAPEGGEGGNNGWPSNDPCDYAKNHIAVLNDFMQSPLFAESKSQILNADPTKEHSFVFGRNGNTTTRSSLQTCSSGTECQVQVSWPGAFADLHNHPNSLPPSPGDIYGLINIHNSKPAYNARFVVNQSGMVTYALLIADLSKANSFKNKYPAVTTPFGPDFPNEIYNVSEPAKLSYLIQGIGTAEAEAASLAYILDFFDSGIILLQSTSANSLGRVLSSKNNQTNNYSIYYCQ